MAAMWGLVFPLVRGLLAGSDGEWEQRFVEKMAVTFASFIDDDFGGLVFLSPNLSPTTRPYACYIRDARTFADGVFTLQLGIPVDVPNLTSADFRDAARGLIAALPKSDIGDWLQRLGEVDPVAVADPALPAPEGSDRSGQ